MRTLQNTLRRPAVFLAGGAIALTMLLAAVACGSAAEPEPSPNPAQNAETSHTHTESATPEAESPADAVVINLPITNRATTLSREDLQVKKGDTVNINFTSDEEGEIHLHGYDLTAPVSPDSPGSLSFVAETAGAFGINFHVFGEDTDAGDGHAHTEDAPALVASDTPVDLSITAEPDAEGGINVSIDVEGFRFDPELVDQARTPGVGHAHIYMDGEKLGRVFESEYHIPHAPPGEREIRVSLNTNDHSELTYAGEKLEAIATVNVPDVGQGHGEEVHESDGHDHGGHSHDDEAGREIVAEVHLGNLEVYP